MYKRQLPTVLRIPGIRYCALCTGIAVLYVSTFSGCGDNEMEEMDCSTTSLTLAVHTLSHPTGCDLADGAIHVRASGGMPPYTFRLNTGAYGRDSAFFNLGAGNYTVTVKDGQGCEKHVEVNLHFQSSLTASVVSQTSNSKCLAPYNGEVTVLASGGSGIYQYAIGGGVFGTSSTFTGLRDGNYTITVKDMSDNCTFVLNVAIGRLSTGITFDEHIRPLFQTKCQLPSCHPVHGDLLTYSSAFNLRNSIKSRTQSGDMPRGGITLTADEKALIACWVDDGAPQN